MTEVWEQPRTSRNWCSKHGFYDCPVCKGLEPVWVIPIMEGSWQTGELRLSEGEAVITGSARLPVVPPEPSEPRVVEHVVYLHPYPAEPPEPVPPVVTAPLDLAAARDLIEQIVLTPAAEMMEDPRWREAAKRGRAVHDKAVVLAEAEDISYSEAIKRIVGES